MTSWEAIWSRSRSTEGFLSRIGKQLAVYGDLQRLVLGILRKNCKIDPGTRILEAGCGSGPVASLLSRKTSSVFGLDISPSAVKIARQNGVLVSLGDARELPFCDSSFNLVYTTGMVDLFDDTEAALILQELSRITCSGGCIVVVTAWSGCTLHETIKKYLIKKKRWNYGPKRTFNSLEHILPACVAIQSEQAMGALFQLRFVSYLFEEHNLLRRLYHLVYLVLAIFLRPLNRLPGAVLVTILEKK